MFILDDNNKKDTIIKHQLLELYVPLIGYEAVSLWIYLKHCVENKKSLSIKDLYLQLQMRESTGKTSLTLLKKYKLLEKKDNKLVLKEPMATDQFIKFVKDNEYIEIETKKRFFTLLDDYFEEAQKEDTKDITYTKPPTQPTIAQKEDEIVARFMSECNFRGTKELRQKFDYWFEQIKDIELMEELIRRTKKKVEMSGIRGCPSNYTDKIVKDWQLKGIRTFKDLYVKDEEFKRNWKVYRMVEKELNKDYDSLTPEERAMVNSWLAPQKGQGLSEDIIKEGIKQVIRKGLYKGKGSPTIAYMNKWMNNLIKANVKTCDDVEKNLFYTDKKQSDAATKTGKKYSQRRSKSELEEAIEKKKVSYEGGN
ncbi:DnaD domain protein [Proteinivorax hydrogeniformans]|uniref:DnaD domain protein n=1 Tax=Proteinivorax hydrogeniformans TaxID=1826727 RepID=A0AAU8HWT4_9FIRM